jgi:hypothetical protein
MPVIALLAPSDVTAADQTPSPGKSSETSGLAALLGAVGASQVPSLSGLIRPEKMGLLTDNKCTAKGNKVHLLSDNEADVDLLSDNKTKLRSDIRILSGLTVHIQITIPADGKNPKAEKARGRHKSRKSKKQADRKSERR